MPLNSIVSHGLSERKSLVIGASGQVGNAITALLGPRYAIASSSGRALPGRIRLDLIDAAEHRVDVASLLEHLGVQAVYCVGGMTDVEGCESKPELARRVNCKGPAAVAAAAAAAKLPFAYFSTEYVFDGKAGPYSEDARPSPISVYGTSKLLGEMEVANAHPGALIIRTTTVYGPDPGGKNFIYSMRRTLLAKRAFRVPNDQMSTPTYNRDLARASIGLMEGGVSGVVNIAGPERLSRLDFARRSATAMKLNPSAILGVPTNQLAQQAPRPLQAGLVTARLQYLCPALHMRTIEEAIHEWIASGEFEDLS